MRTVTLGKYSSIARDYNQKVEAKLAAIDAEVAATGEACAVETDRHIGLVIAKDRLEELDHELRSLDEQVKEALLASVSERTETLARLILYRDIVKCKLERLFPGWIKKLQYAQRIVREDGYDNRTRWRGALESELNNTLTLVIDKYGPKLPIVTQLRDLILRINSYSRDDLLARMKALHDTAMEAEATLTELFRKLKQDMDDLNAAIKEIQACPPARALQHHECVQQKRAKQNEARECRKLLEKLSEGANEEGEEKEQKDRVKGGEKGRAEGKEKGKEKGKQEGKEKEGTLTRAGIVQLIDKQRHLLAHDTHLCSRYNRLLRQCTEKGDWAGALRVYGSMLKWHHPIRHTTFRQIIRACTHAEPARSDIAVDVLEEMWERGMKVEASVYNLVLDCCREGRHWRRALQVFKEMTEKRVTPTTHTYSLLHQIGRTARDDPTVVYEAFKFAGVPSYLAYTAASANANEYTPPIATPY